MMLDMVVVAPAPALMEDGAKRLMPPLPENMPIVLVFVLVKVPPLKAIEPVEMVLPLRSKEPPLVMMMVVLATELYVNAPPVTV